ncbi:MAG: YdcH family protein [Pseudomonadota bacterium]
MAAEPPDGSRQIRHFVFYYAAVTLCLKGTAPMDKAMVEELESKHAALHALIEEEEQRTHPDEDLLHRLKKEKLRLKDEMTGHLTH